jgi:hypothetical protein
MHETIDVQHCKPAAQLCGLQWFYTLARGHFTAARLHKVTQSYMSKITVELSKPTV